jgi:hypothetical protein
LPVEVPVESRTKLRSDLSIDWTNDVPVEWSIDMPTEWWIELPIEMPGEVPTEMPSELPSPESNVGSGCESGRERVGKWTAAVGRNDGRLLGPGRRRERRGVTARDAGRVQRDDDRGGCFCR